MRQAMAPLRAGRECSLGVQLLIPSSSSVGRRSCSNRSLPLQCWQPQPPHQQQQQHVVVAAAVPTAHPLRMRQQSVARTRRLAVDARRTVSGSDSSQRSRNNAPPTLKQPRSGAASSSSSSSHKADARKQQQPASRAASPSPANQSSRPQLGSSSSGGPGGGPNNRSQQQQQQPSRLEAFMRDTPGFNRFLDGTLILGDAVMVAATELSSERIPLEQLPALAGIAVATWVAAGAALGDYMRTPDPDANPLSDALGWPIFQAIVNSMITWAVALVLSLLGYAWLVSSYVVDPEMVMEVAHDGQLSPQLEVSVALLITMSCWRGTAARLRL